MKFSQNILNAIKQGFGKSSYSKYSTDQLLDFFRSENWGNLDESQRIHLFQELENRRAPLENRAPARIIEENNPLTYGRYHVNDNTISIDVWDTANPYECLDTYIHESNHAFQDHTNKTYGDSLTDHTDIMNRAELAKNPDGTLYNYQSGGSPYYNVQCDELESNNRAAQYLLDQKERFMDDPAYQEYMQGRADYYSSVNDSLSNDAAGRTKMQEEQLYNSWVREDITTEQYESASANLQNPDYIDETVSQSYQIEDQVYALNSAMEEDNQEEDVEIEVEEEDVEIDIDEEEDIDKFPNENLNQEEDEEEEIDKLPNSSTTTTIDKEEIETMEETENEDFGIE